MNLRFTPMTEEEYQAYLDFIVPDYARENVTAGYWDETEALERSRQAMASLLPEGIKTPGHYLYIVRDGEQRVGVVWFQARTDQPTKSGFIYDIMMDKAQRGKGYGKSTMQLLEEKARELGLSQIGLHVFAHNAVAKRLYEKLGYEVTSQNMVKKLT